MRASHFPNAGRPSARKRTCVGTLVLARMTASLHSTWGAFMSRWAQRFVEQLSAACVRIGPDDRRALMHLMNRKPIRRD